MGNKKTYYFFASSNYYYQGPGKFHLISSHVPLTKTGDFSFIKIWSTKFLGMSDEI